MNRVLYICNKKAPCNCSKSCGPMCNLTANPIYAVNFTTVKDVITEMPRPQQITGHWENIEGTDEAMCSYCWTRLKPRTAHGKIFKMCPICGTFMNLEQSSHKNQ